ncbi:hypothetical protein CL657_05865 [bacterium]|nr:hypothetical protein [bacterium]|tara:strand:- start:2055 stop:4181 length:2127 start_codon:yes stop_codon:yes gene_type:complete
MSSINLFIGGNNQEFISELKNHDAIYGENNQNNFLLQENEGIITFSSLQNDHEWVTILETNDYEQLVGKLYMNSVISDHTIQNSILNINFIHFGRQLIDFKLVKSFLEHLNKFNEVNAAVDIVFRTYLVLTEDNSELNQEEKEILKNNLKEFEKLISDNTIIFRNIILLDTFNISGENLILNKDSFSYLIYKSISLITEHTYRILGNIQNNRIISIGISEFICDKIRLVRQQTQYLLNDAKKYQKHSDENSLTLHKKELNNLSTKFFNNKIDFEQFRDKIDDLLIDNKEQQTMMSLLLLIDHLSPTDSGMFSHFVLNELIYEKLCRLYPSKKDFELKQFKQDISSWKKRSKKLKQEVETLETHSSYKKFIKLKQEIKVLEDEEITNLNSNPEEKTEKTLTLKAELEQLKADEFYAVFESSLLEIERLAEDEESIKKRNAHIISKLKHYKSGLLDILKEKTPEEKPSPPRKRSFWDWFRKKPERRQNPVRTMIRKGSDDNQKILENLIKFKEKINQNKERIKNALNQLERVEIGVPGTYKDYNFRRNVDFSGELKKFHDNNWQFVSKEISNKIDVMVRNDNFSTANFLKIIEKHSSNKVDVDLFAYLIDEGQTFGFLPPIYFEELISFLEEKSKPLVLLTRDNSNNVNCDTFIFVNENDKTESNKIRFEEKLRTVDCLAPQIINSSNEKGLTYFCVSYLDEMNDISYLN